MDVNLHVSQPLGQLLVAQGVVSVRQVEEALSEQQRTGKRLGEILIARGFASRIAIIDALAQQAGLLLEPETGFGAGLREQLERRYRRSHGSEHKDLGGVAPPALETERPHSSTELQTALLDEVRGIAASDEVRDDVLRSNAPEIDFLAVATKARQHVAARRAGLPELR